MRVGRLTKAHGLKGAIKIELYTDDPDRRFTPGARFTLQVPTSSPWHGKMLELRELRWYNSHPVAFFQDVPDRTTAESLIKAILWIDHDDSEQSPEEDAWYDHQLVGLAVQRDGVRVGTISRVDHLPAQDLLAVTTADAEVLVPFVKAIVTSVDLQAGVVTVDPPIGLFEEPPEDEAPASDSARTGSSDAPTGDDGTSDDAAEETDMTDAGATSPEIPAPSDADLVEKLPDEASDALMEDGSADADTGPVDDSLTRAQSEVQIAEGESAEGEGAEAEPSGETDAEASESDGDDSAPERETPA